MPIHVASREGKTNVVEILLRNGAKVNEKDVRKSRLRNRFTCVFEN